jgi:glutamyl-tRNA synthetase
LQRSEWNAAALEAAVRALAEEKSAKLGQLAQPLRAALTGKSASPPIFDMMVALGRDETLLRIGSVAA